jgi:hypothetical protein
MMLRLAAEKPFAQGGNRLCFVHPDNPDLCIKVRRPDFSLKDRRRKKGFPKNLRPLSSFDDNREEHQVMQQLKRHYGAVLYEHISHCCGFEETDLGKGLVSELVRDADGRISQTLKKYLWDHGLNSAIQTAIASFESYWLRESIPSRDLLLHNIVVQMDGDMPVRLVVIDGLGSSGFIPLLCLPRRLRNKKIVKKIANFHERIGFLIEQRGADEFPGYHGLLFHDGLSQTD